MEQATEVLWLLNRHLKLLEIANMLEKYGRYSGNIGLGRRFALEALAAIEKIGANVNLYPVREVDIRVVPLNKSGYILLYRVERIDKSVKVLILDVRKAY